MISYDELDQNSKEIIDKFMNGNGRIKRTILKMIYNQEGLDKLIESDDVDVHTELINIGYESTKSQLLKLEKFKNGYGYNNTNLLKEVVNKIENLEYLESVFEEAEFWTRLEMVKRANRENNKNILKKIISYDLFYKNNNSYYNYTTNLYNYSGSGNPHDQNLRYDFVEEVQNIGVNLFELFNLNLPLDNLITEYRRGNVSNEYKDRVLQIIKNNTSDKNKIITSKDIKSIKTLEEFNKIGFYDEDALIAVVMSDMSSRDKIEVLNKYRNCGNAGLARLAYKFLNFV